MSDKLLDTEIGGEQTQYEGTHTFVDPHEKLAGTMGGSHPQTNQPLTSKSTSTARQHDPSHPLSHNVSGAESARFGRTMREGMGGTTTGSLGEARVEGGFGGTAALHDEGDSEAKERREQGYGGKHDMDRNIGG